MLYFTAAVIFLSSGNYHKNMRSDFSIIKLKCNIKESHGMHCRRDHSGFQNLFNARWRLKKNEKKNKKFAVGSFWF